MPIQSGPPKAALRVSYTRFANILVTLVFLRANRMLSPNRRPVFSRPHTIRAVPSTSLSAFRGPRKSPGPSPPPQQSSIAVHHVAPSPSFLIPPGSCDSPSHQDKFRKDNCAETRNSAPTIPVVSIARSPALSFHFHT